MNQQNDRPGTPPDCQDWFAWVLGFWIFGVLVLFILGFVGRSWGLAFGRLYGFLFALI